MIARLRGFRTWGHSLQAQAEKQIPPSPLRSASGSTIGNGGMARPNPRNRKTWCITAPRTSLYFRNSMWRVGSKLFLGMLATSIFTNAVAVYLLHDVDADQIGRLNFAYWELMLEFLVFAIVVTATFLLVSWIGSLVLKLRVVNSGLRLGYVLGIAVILIQYPAEFMVRMLNQQHSADSFLLAYLLLAPICCAAILFLDTHRQRSAD